MDSQDFRIVVLPRVLGSGAILLGAAILVAMLWLEFRVLDQGGISFRILFYVFPAFALFSWGVTQIVGVGETHGAVFRRRILLAVGSELLPQDMNFQDLNEAAKIIGQFGSKVSAYDVQRASKRSDGLRDLGLLDQREAKLRSDAQRLAKQLQTRFPGLISESRLAMLLLSLGQSTHHVATVI